jgi:uncharacterized protein YjeT (DUF2065 family)
MNEFFQALALVFVIEGLAYALFPGLLKRMLARLFTMPDDLLRATGLLAAAAGVVAVWLIRS